ncbi:AraC family transcriptional regulator [Burkholderia plantarii]|uniref:AraC family transcriptional regulator n=1 Tax=Burkholderia plantarii TaxID=41899 RepID=UPI0006D8C683|nr:AraC family transcriptional regulator [Burkholderia plantarii]ALK34664.1 AraC family transcriptional regulator [Burkholderia plantarii]GLZ22340.1 AraC family transcriptional regulator [Burkholderia plantarii]
MTPNPLLDAVQRYTDRRPGEDLHLTGIDGIAIVRATRERPQSHLILRPALCLVLQGAKQTRFGARDFLYRAGEMLVVGVEMPAIGRIVEGSKAAPYFGLSIELDMTVMAAVLEAFDAPPPAAGHTGPGVFVETLRAEIADCALRAIRLLDTPHAIPVLYPGIMRELCYWLLAGPRGGEIVGMMLANGQAERVVRAIHALREGFAASIRIDDLARLARMSPSAFHRQFKALTSMTPLQYQKQLRLLEARRLIANDVLKVEEAAFRVGYESPSQFSREYSRMFGISPKRDASGLLAAMRDGRRLTASGA